MSIQNSCDFDRTLLIVFLTLIIFSVFTSCPQNQNIVPEESSIEFGRILYGTDNCLISEVPAGGTLFSVWTKIPDPGSELPWSRGNMDVYVLRGVNWHMRCLTGNSWTDAVGTAGYNANSMLFADTAAHIGTWVNDYSFYLSSEGVTESICKGWVWGAWQIIVEADSMIIRQWLKFGPTGEVFAAGEDTITFAEIRNTLVAEREWTREEADAWIPSDAVSFQVGSDNGYLYHARMETTNTLPTLKELDSIAKLVSPDENAWGFYDLNWDNGSPDIADKSANGHDLVINTGGVLYEGDLAPQF